jgi:NAD(P)H-dependent flavin oxidoreductase YrpB (nitropropane dioxygenase family)
MGTRFLLTSDSEVPEAVKSVYLASPVTGTVVTTRVDGVPHRVLRTPLVEKLEGTPAIVSLPRALANARRFRRISGMSWRQMLTEGRAMRKTGDLSWSQVLMAANTPMLLRATMVDGNVDAGVMASGQVVGVIEDLPSAKEVVERIIGEAEAVLARLAPS